MTGGDDGDDSPDEFREGVYGRLSEEAPPPPALKTNFAPWHHPVKQVVRTEQWAKLVGKLLADEGAPEDGILRYLTLPGDDLLDVRTVAEACGGKARVRYLGFNSSETVDELAPWAEAQATLQQESLADPQSQVLPDRIEDIAAPGSNAASRLESMLPFDVINLDACNHLSYVRGGRQTSLFDALARIIEHQLRATRPWLLFITTRVATDFLVGAARDAFDAAIAANLLAAEGFGLQLCETLDIKLDRLDDELLRIWSGDGKPLLQLFAVSLGKHILSFIHAQPNFRARVELASIYCYAVRKGPPDMLALALRITPGRMRLAQPGQTIAPAPIEPADALQIARRAAKIANLDDEIAKDGALLLRARLETEKLLMINSYDITAYRVWLSEHPIRPIDVAA